jgi:hypothetical protein
MPICSVSIGRTTPDSTNCRTSLYPLRTESLDSRSEIEIGDQRPARKMPLRSPNSGEFEAQRLATNWLSGGNHATIFSPWTWPAETTVAGWGWRIRTSERRNSFLVTRFHEGPAAAQVAGKLHPSRPKSNELLVVVKKGRAKTHQLGLPPEPHPIVIPGSYRSTTNTSVLGLFSPLTLS